MKKQIILFILLSLLFFVCDVEKEKKNNDNLTKNKTNIEKNIKEKNPLNISIKINENINHTIGDDIEINIDVENISINDSVFLFINNIKKKVLKKDNLDYVWNSSKAKTGTNIIKVIFKTKKSEFKAVREIILLSDIKPEMYSYKIKKTFKHDRAAYTQGFFYDKGFLYEATGLKGESTVRKVKLETGEVIQSFAISREVFGEGITQFDDKIVQLSWQAGIGFVYDFNSFKLIDEFSYSGEGWGIAYGEDKLFMTNGTNEIKILEKQSFSVIDKLEVYDDKAEVRYLNELEYIDGAIYSNIYQSEKIAKIDPTTGKVIAYIDLKRILQANDYKSDTDVLNGIAYDNKNKRLFVTGKKWPKVFEIELIKK